ncbi:uncharacterized protein C2845_PM17G02730 [Panicum miliaceum]|uniref:Uncharacterized protein n=1 Tax=Panicum miliaceum TaxID=4540 RepID=A0A3L6Q2L6_PANMI|nr:uncharacterized protein C2845_PM17G02730 [Panicum miliaceum]
MAPRRKSAAQTREPAETPLTDYEHFRAQNMMNNQIFQRLGLSTLASMINNTSSMSENDVSQESGSFYNAQDSEGSEQEVNKVLPSGDLPKVPPVQSLSALAQHLSAEPLLPAARGERAVPSLTWCEDRSCCRILSQWIEAGVAAPIKAAAMDAAKATASVAADSILGLTIPLVEVVVMAAMEGQCMLGMTQQLVTPYILVVVGLRRNSKHLSHQTLNLSSTTLPPEDDDPMDFDDFGGGNGSAEDKARDASAKKPKSDSQTKSKLPQTNNIGVGFAPMQCLIAVTPMGNCLLCPPRKPVVLDDAQPDMAVHTSTEESARGLGAPFPSVSPTNAGVAGRVDGPNAIIPQC